MDTGDPAGHASPPLSPVAEQFGLEIDAMMMSVSEISLSLQIHSQESHLALENKEVYREVEPQVDWALDLRNPRNWPVGKKWAAVGTMTAYSIMANMVSAMMAPALPKIADQFHIVSETKIALTLSIYMLSGALSPLVYAPLSEMFGRTWVLHINNFVFIFLNLGCAFAPSTGILILFRFLSGWAGGSPTAVGGGIVGDVFAAEDRAWAMAAYALGSVLAPALSPAIGGFMTETIGWRYIFILVSGMSAVTSVAGILLYRETYAPVIRRRIEQEMRAARQGLESQAYLPEIQEDSESRLNYLLTNLQRPFMLLTRSIICFVFSLYMAFMYGIYYLMIATFPDLFLNVYHFNTGLAGLAYLGVGIGFTAATAVGGHFGNKVYHALAARNGGQGKPEMRVPVILIGSLMVPIGLFWYGWSAEEKIHWIMPIIGTGFFGFGTMMTFLPIHLYFVDTYTFAASALSAASVSRFLLAFAFPLFGTQMFDVLGIGVGNSLLAALAIALGVPFPIFIWFYGERLRARSSWTR